MLNNTNDGGKTSKQIVASNPAEIISPDSDRIQAFEDQQDYLDLDEGKLLLS
jgi:hypothetical protein